MLGTIPRDSLVAQGAHFCTLDNGNEAAVSLYASPIGSIVWAAYERWAWEPENFTALGGGTIAASDPDLVMQIMTSANLQDTGSPTWTQLNSGDPQYTYNGLSGGPAVSARFGDWLVSHSVLTDEQATDMQWFQDTLIVGLNPIIAPVFAAVVTPEPDLSAPLPPDQQFPPGAVGPISNALGLLQAQATRLTLTANGNVPVLGCIPVPTA